MAFIDTFRLENYGEFCAINTTSVTVTLAEAQDAVPAVDKFAVTIDGAANAVKEVKAVDGDTTKKKFVLTLTDSLANREGILKVNGFAPANISGADFNFDFKAPAVESVMALNSTTVEVKFSEKLGKASAEKKEAYKISRVAAGTNEVAKTAILSVDGKTVTLSLTTALVDAPNGYALTINGDTTVPANNTVADVKGNKLPVSERIFSGVITVDNTKPAIAKATYDKTTGKLVLTLSKQVLVSDASVDETKITFKGASGSYTLTEADYNPTVAEVSNNELTFVLSPAGKTAVNALGDTLTLDIAADVFSDTSATPLKNEAVTGFVVEQTAAPQLSTAAYDENTRKLTLVFTESDINVSDFKVTGIKVNNVALTAKSTVDTTANGKTVVISVGPDTVITSGGLLAIDATAAKNTAGTAVIPATNKAITFTADTTKPVINAVEFNDGTMELTFKLSELIDFTKFGAVTGIKLTDGTRSYALTDSTFLGAAAAANNSSTVRVQLSATDATAILTTANTKLDLTKLKVEVAADTFKDVSIAANGNLVINTANAIVVQYVDNAAPTATIAAGQSSTTAVVTFSEKVNAEQAKNPANYTLKAGLVTLPVTSAYLGVDGMTVTLTTAEQSAVDYVLTLNNITDLKGNAYVNPTDPTSFVKFTGVPVTADTVKPEVISAIYVDNGNGEPGPGDQIKVTFSEPIATPIANVKFADFDFGSAFTGMTADNTTFAYGSTNEQIIITLGTGATVTWADPANVTVNSSAASGLKDAAGNAADGKNASSVTTAQQLAAPGGTAQIVSVTYTDANGDYTKSVGDKITIKFNKAVKLGATPKADDLFDAVEAGVLGVVDSGTYAAMTLDTADTIVITTTAVPTVAFKATDAIAGNATTVKVTDAWGQAVTKLGTGIAVTKADASNATLTSASYNKTTKKLTLTFSASLLTAKTSDGSLATELVVLSGGAPATLTGNFIPENAAALKSGQIVLDVADAADQAILESGVATIQIKGGGSAKIATNAYDAKVLPAAQPITVTVTQ